MKNSPYILLVLFVGMFLSACKIQSKQKLNNNQVLDNKTVTKDNKPYVSTIKSNYVLKDSSSIQVYFEIEILHFSETWINNLSDFEKSFKINWFLTPDSGVKEKLKNGKIELKPENAHFANNKLYIDFSIPKLAEYPQLILNLEMIDVEGARKFTHESFINNSGKRINTRFGIFEIASEEPSFKNYFLLDDEIVIKALNGQRTKLYLKHYLSEEPPALSPMSSTKRPDLSGFIEVATVPIYSGEKIKLSETGTYVLSEDSSFINNAFGFFVGGERFPRLTDVEELKTPLYYMSTNKEIELLKKDAGKLALDKYFLSMTSGNQTLAKQIIKNYFRRVEKVNDLFTTYKEGGKRTKVWFI